MPGLSSVMSKVCYDESFDQFYLLGLVGYGFACNQVGRYLINISSLYISSLYLVYIVQT